MFYSHLCIYFGSAHALNALSLLILSPGVTETELYLHSVCDFARLRPISVSLLVLAGYRTRCMVYLGLDQVGKFFVLFKWNLLLAGIACDCVRIPTQF
jgi:hypothetical protein